MATYNFDFYSTLVCMVAVLLLGRFIIARLKVLQDYNIPEPVIGGLIAALIILGIYKYLHIEFKFDSSLKDPLMLAFFTSVGLSADFASLKKGGKMLWIFLFFVSILLILQNVIGLSLAYVMNVNALVGLLGGSITMSGGHGTGAAWAAEFIKAPYNFTAATEVAMACATFGLVIGDSSAVLWLAILSSITSSKRRARTLRTKKAPLKSPKKSDSSRLQALWSP